METNAVPGPSATFIQKMVFLKVAKEGIRLKSVVEDDRNILDSITLKKLALVYKNVECPTEIEILITVNKSGPSPDMEALKAEVAVKDAAKLEKLAAKKAALEAELAKLQLVIA